MAPPWRRRTTMYSCRKARKSFDEALVGVTDMAAVLQARKLPPAPTVAIDPWIAISAIALAATTEAGWGGVMLYVATTGLSLATFGTHNDTALAFANRAPPDADLGDALRRELSAELERDRADLMSLSPSPNVALLMTFIAICLHLFGLRWLLAAA